jgi:hypothetical protein
MAGSRKPPGTPAGVSRHHWKGDFSKTDHGNCTKNATDLVQYPENSSPFKDPPKFQASEALNKRDMGLKQKTPKLQPLTNAKITTTDKC